MDTPDITTQVLIQIRDRLDQVFAEQVETNRRIDETNKRIDRTNRHTEASLSSELGALRDTVRELRDEVREVKGDLREVKDDVRNLKVSGESDDGLRQRVARCESDIADLRRR